MSPIVMLNEVKDLAVGNEQRGLAARSFTPFRMAAMLMLFVAVLSDSSDLKEIICRR
jgi:hypothetical protein